MRTPASVPVPSWAQCSDVQGVYIAAAVLGGAGDFSPAPHKTAASHTIGGDYDPPIVFSVHATFLLTKYTECCILCVSLRKDDFMARIQISIDDDALQKIDDFVKECGLNRSSFLVMAALEHIKAKEAMPVISGAFASIAGIVNARVRGEITNDEAQLQIDALHASMKQIADK